MTWRKFSNSKLIKNMTWRKFSNSKPIIKIA
jgi:hypothetical protein